MDYTGSSTSYETDQIDYISVSPRFSAADKKSLDDGFAFLNENGYAVIGDVLKQDEIDLNKDLLWKFIEHTSQGNIKRDDPDTWSNQWPAFSSHGVINGLGIGQSELLWSVRSSPQVKNVFAQLWNTRELLVSFDGCGVFRDWRYNLSWKTNGGWTHVDQNPKLKPDRCCVQGIVALTDQNERTGGLIVYPRTHFRFHELCDLTKNSWDFVRVPSDHALINQGTGCGKLVHCRAGDLILFDSRLIHCNAPAVALEERRSDEPVGLLRIVAYVSMSPSGFVSGQILDEFRTKRKEMLENNLSLTHWSTEFVISQGNHENLPKVSLDRFNAYQKALIFGTPEECAA